MTITFDAIAGKVQSEKLPPPFIGQRASQFTFPPKALLISIVVAGLLAFLILSRLPVFRSWRKVSGLNRLKNYCNYRVITNTRITATGIAPDFHRIPFQG